MTALGAPKEDDFEEEYTLRLIPSIKKYNVGRFNEPTLPNFSKCPQPVVMYEEPEKAPEEDEEKDKEPVGWNPALRKRRRRRRKDNRIKNWIIEDNESKTKFTGTVEGGVTSTYMLMVKTPHKNEFQVVPVEQWFRFKKPLNYRTLTLEEAEEFNNEKKRAVERWLMNHNLAGEKKNDTEVVPTSSIKTGALKSAGAAAAAKSDDIFTVAETKGGRRRPRKAAAEGDPTGDDGGDFDEVFDDDESGHEIEGGNKGVAAESESSDDEMEDGSKDKKAAVSLDELLKRTQEQSKKDGAVENGDKESDDDDDKESGGAQKYDYDDYGSLITNKPAEGTADAAAAPTETKPAAPAKPAPGKRALDDKADESSNKKSKTSTQLKLTEAGVQEELIRFGGRMKTRDLIKRLKKFLITNEDKALLRDILRTICDKEEDPVDGVYMVLKTQFR
ncbi:hypothetical protein SPRG_19062 [Saprolegnia parasitica CBS 223.65]|uniref:Transcription initiation factor IIF subunit alpha n=1 Tax=Saprolegnia parasitica (strain CBS 223.65) TaxID=695850 RepID=A0A067CU74_SAPPC|nr:hypothetical protein SPRG_19062 [Saprolegnia parasitica CBS 223.65]KDO34224.1 hypothetical protein SPRG_19062 [Saprolegnia parasitica CBS 223.65]|eukprot:XP_012195258.1 hypothetical protein SPRG_19062 [Saprolegnia parasitica CBS 223.65]